MNGASYFSITSCNRVSQAVAPIFYDKNISIFKSVVYAQTKVNPSYAINRFAYFFLDVPVHYIKQIKKNCWPSDIPVSSALPTSTYSIQHESRKLINNVAFHPFMILFKANKLS